MAHDSIILSLFATNFTGLTQKRRMDDWAPRCNLFGFIHLTLTRTTRVLVPEVMLPNLTSPKLTGVFTTHNNFKLTTTGK